jgi:hypothetical protein
MKRPGKRIPSELLKIADILLTQVALEKGLFRNQRYSGGRERGRES